jgi:hypothetical protein
MANTPKTQAKPQVSFFVYKGDKKKAKPLTDDLGPSLISLEMQAMANGGYTVRGRFSDVNFNIYNRLIENDYFSDARMQPMKVQFKCKWSNQAKTPQSATTWIIGYIISMECMQPEMEDRNQIEFVIIDPPSWYLNVGDASGKCYTGNVGQVIRDVVTEYSPKDRLDLEISTTIDSKQGKWWMMRQDPKSFLSSLFDWSASITPTKTQWVFAPDNYSLVIKPQGLFTSEQRRYYSFHRNKTSDPIKQVTVLTDNALSSVQTKLITQGLSTISGQYLDYQTSQQNVEVGDSNTTQKKTARVKKNRSFQKPEGGESVGYTSVMTVPEIGSAGDMGLPYKDYIDGRPRSMFLNLINSLMRAKVTVIGDGEWTGCRGLGIDTIFLDWVRASRNGEEGKIADLRHWYTGSWLVYGYCHKITNKSWTTDLYCARYDQNSESVKVPAKS